jgi:hypothetical protein
MHPHHASYHHHIWLHNKTSSYWHNCIQWQHTQIVCLPMLWCSCLQHGYSIPANILGDQEPSHWFRDESRRHLFVEHSDRTFGAVKARPRSISTGRPDEIDELSEFEDKIIRLLMEHGKLGLSEICKVGEARHLQIFPASV